MKELTLTEVESVNGGVVPFIAAVVAFDLGLIGAMWVTQQGMAGQD